MRKSWTDERLDDLADRVDRGFERVDARFEKVELRLELLSAQFEKLDDRFAAFQRTTFQFYGLVVAALIGVIATQA